MKGEMVSENVLLRGIDTIVTREGGKLECWDLHIGMKLNLLGRKMTLMQADLVTVNWLEQQAVKLRKMKVREKCLFLIVWDICFQYFNI